MGKKLVIAEKPSVAADLARALGRVPKEGDFYENDEFIITSALGHLVELCLPGEVDKKRGKWSFANLPIIPEKFELKTVEKSKERFALIKRLLKRADVTEVINACDAGREGELIFHNIMRHAGSRKPVRRLWLQSMTPEAIREGFQQLRDGEEMRPLTDAAVCRSESDWLVGINGTRAITAFNSKGSGFLLTPVGRVQTPTLAILADREHRIRNFEPRKYFEVSAEFAVAGGIYKGRWFDEKFQKSSEDDRAERIWQKERAEEIASKCAGQPGIIEEQRTPSSQIAPQLYDLTTLQREANSRLGLSARRTLQIAQALYERHKVLTYPRTDSRYLPSDYLETVQATMLKLDMAGLAEHAEKAIKMGWVKLSRRIFDDAKVSDHFAIIPTGVATKSLDEFERKVFDMVARRFVAAFFPAAQFEVTKRVTRVAGEAFRSEGKVIVAPGWMEVYGKEAQDGDEDKSLCEVKPGERALAQVVEVKESQTRPPARFTEATLLSAMEGAGKLVEDEELREAMSQRGLGTPATRATIIEGLIQDGYVLRQGRELVVTQKGLSLIHLLRGLGIEALTSPEMTGEWEFKLKRMEGGQIGREEFMGEIKRFTEEIVHKAKTFEGSFGAEGVLKDLDVACPRCGSVGFRETYKAYECKNCGLIIWKTMAGRELEREEAVSLLKEGRVGPLEGFRSKLGRRFSAVVKLDGEFKQVFDFPDRGDGDADFTRMPVVFESCPACKVGKIHDAGDAFICSRSPECKFRMGKVICQHEVAMEEVIRLFKEGRTGLIRRFISKKGKPFAAYLKLEDGKVVFEFEKAEGGSGGRGRKGAKSKTRDSIK